MRTKFPEGSGDRNDARPDGEDSASPWSGSSWLGGALIFQSHRCHPQVAGSRCEEDIIKVAGRENIF